MGTWGDGGQNISCPPLLGIENKITYFNIYLRFTVIFIGLIQTCSHSVPIFRYSEHVQYTEDERKQKSYPQ